MAAVLIASVALVIFVVWLPVWRYYSKVFACKVDPDQGAQWEQEVPMEFREGAENGEL